ncbi:glutamine amidotransferase [alpha proteobacterium BAL199]|jgi:GMP synthase (glutamine-hydrolysing)|nr:glutamine amidotransferase [alpha proteobacterium BAL199]
MPDKVLIVVHQKHSTPGRVGELLEARGYTLDRLCPCLDHPLPPDPSEYAAVVVFGGPMSANDDHCLAGIGREIDYTNRVLDSGVPYLGICLGAQILARALGGSVTPHPQNHVEVGYTRVEPVPGAEELFEHSRFFYQWHREGFEMPRGATPLATGTGAFPNQAFRVGEKVYGLQFHPEITLAMIHRWNLGGGHRLHLPGAQPKRAHLKGFELFNDGIERWTNALFDRMGLMGVPLSRAEAAE